MDNSLWLAGSPISPLFGGTVVVPDQHVLVLNLVSRPGLSTTLPHEQPTIFLTSRGSISTRCMAAKHLRRRHRGAPTCCPFRILPEGARHASVCATVTTQSSVCLQLRVLRLHLGILTFVLHLCHAFGLEADAVYR